MELIKRERKIVKNLNYGGVCDGCGMALSIPEIIGIEIFKNDVLLIIFPIDDFICPNCFHSITYFKIWASLNVTKELQKKGV